MASLVLLVLGSLALLLTGAWARFVPPSLCPDVALLFAVSLALRVGGGRAILAAAALGYGADLVSGAPFGLHALLSVGAFALARGADRSLDLRRPLAVAALVALLAPLYALAAVALAQLRGIPFALGLDTIVVVGLRAAVNALCAPAVDALAVAVSARAGDEDLGRRASPLGGGRRPA